MNAYHIMIQVCNSTPMIWRKIEVSDELSFYQLHEAILILFHWKQACNAHFKISNHHLHMNGNTNHTTEHLPLSTYIQEAQPFTYVYGNSDEELWELSLFACKVTSEYASIQLLDYEHEFPIYGMGGVIHYQKIMKEVKNYTRNSSFHLLIDRLTYPFDKDEIASSLTTVFNQNREVASTLHKQQFNHELQHCRTLLESNHSIAPNLVVLKIQDQTYPCYIDFLDDGIEVMVFYDQSGFARSIINSISDDPDLLFTNALTINFLYEDSDATQLYLYDKRNLCFINKAGCLPTCPKDKDIIFLTTLLKYFNNVLANRKLPPLSKHKMLVATLDSIVECPYEISEEICSVQVSKEEKKQLSKLPHTNECIALNFTAVPGAHCEKSKHLDIHLVARGNRYVKDEVMNVESMPMLIEQLYSFLDELLHDRCIPESISTNSINLTHMLQQFCDTFHINLQLFTPSSQYKDDLLEVLANTLNLTAEELLIMDEFEKDDKMEQIYYNENLQTLKASSLNKYYN